jgi:hypothetical protein
VVAHRSFLPALLKVPGGTRFGSVVTPRTST